VILETEGGYAEVAERIADLLHNNFDAVEFIVPNYAMSAGTILVMSGDEIWMDYHSVLGPIDPQVAGPKGGLIPAQGYLVQYERLIEKSRKGTITTAELNFLISNFDPAELYRYEQENDLSNALLKDWLVKYKFRHWNKTATRGKPVTKRTKSMRANKIANALNDTEEWHSHGRGISMEILRNDVGLKIEDFGVKDCVNNCIRRYYKLLRDYMMKLGTPSAVHVLKNFFPMKYAR
jgi:ClpP class serine protease